MKPLDEMPVILGSSLSGLLVSLSLSRAAVDHVLVGGEGRKRFRAGRVAE